MAFNLRGTSPNVTKMYLQCIADAAAPGSRIYEYVTTDALATVDGSGYIENSTDEGDIALDMLKIGDLIYVYVVGSLDDTRSISEDKATALTDIGLFIVMENDGTAINLSDDILGGAAPVYGD